MVNMRPEQALFFAIYIAGLSSARPLAQSDDSLNLGGLESMGLSALSQYQAASATATPTKTTGTASSATTTGGSVDVSAVDVSAIEADVSKVMSAASQYLHITSLPHIPTFLGLPAAEATECASKIVAVAEPSITANPMLMDTAVANAMGVAGKYLSTTTQSGSTLLGLPASDLPKVASEIVTLVPAGVKSAAASMISDFSSDAASIESLVVSATPTQYRGAAQSIYVSDIPSSIKSKGASVINSVVTGLPTDVQSGVMSIETGLPSGIQNDISALLGGGAAPATPTPSVTSSSSASLPITTPY